mmetsp:Transcript_4543/g.12690  ORF Transcript_4543/g.12690 Transcript_4543/m.12690 type:complete len:85 (-) Transcript_4543:367-621(-)
MNASHVDKILLNYSPNPRQEVLQDQGGEFCPLDFNPRKECWSGKVQFEGLCRPDWADVEERGLPERLHLKLEMGMVLHSMLQAY